MQRYNYFLNLQAFEPLFSEKFSSAHNI